MMRSRYRTGLTTLIITNTKTQVHMRSWYYRMLFFRGLEVFTEADFVNTIKKKQFSDMNECHILPYTYTILNMHHLLYHNSPWHAKHTLVLAWYMLKTTLLLSAIVDGILPLYLLNKNIPWQYHSGTCTIVFHCNPMLYHGTCGVD